MPSADVSFMDLYSKASPEDLLLFYLLVMGLTDDFGSESASQSDKRPTDAWPPEMCSLVRWIARRVRKFEATRTSCDSALADEDKCRARLILVGP